VTRLLLLFQSQNFRSAQDEIIESLGSPLHLKLPVTDLPPPVPFRFQFRFRGSPKILESRSLESEAEFSVFFFLSVHGLVSALNWEFNHSVCCVYVEIREMSDGWMGGEEEGGGV
jgi:hypothetical protein